MNCPRCENNARRVNRRWECTGCGHAFKSRPVLLPPSFDPMPAPLDPMPAPAPAPPPAAPAQPSAPATSRGCIHPGDLLRDLQGRLHRAEACSTEGLMLMVPVDHHDLPPVAMDCRRPDPWQRVEWGGRL